MPLYYNKIDSYRWINGSIRQDLQPDERSVWADLLALAGLTREPRRGFIERSEGIPYPKMVILAMLNISEELFDRTVNKCVIEGRLKVEPDGTLLISNWQRYNSMENWHKGKEEKEEKEEAKNIAIEKNKKKKETNENIQKGLVRTVNELTGVVKSLSDKVQYTPNPRNPDELVNIETGEIFKTIKVSKIDSGDFGAEQNKTGENGNV